MYQFHVGPGHGWVEVPLFELQKIGIQDKISKYSYRFGDTCYLEEDCDAPRFDDAYTKFYGKKPEIITKIHDDDSFIRNLPRYW